MGENVLAGKSGISATVVASLNVGKMATVISLETLHDNRKTRSSTKELLKPFKEPKRVFHSTKKIFKTPSPDYLSSLEFDLFFNHENQSEEEEVTEAMGEPTIEEYMMKTEEDYGSGIASSKFDDKAHFEMKG
nr:hypothetical protein [Tanacetum cinerariifolium]